MTRPSVVPNCCRYWASMGIPCYREDHRQEAASNDSLPATAADLSTGASEN